MKVFDKDTMDSACRHCHIKDPGQVTIMESAALAACLEKETGIPVIHMELGSPGLAPNRIGLEAEKKALDTANVSAYPPTDGLPVLKEAASRFAKAFLNLDFSPARCIPTTGSMLGAFAAFAACTQCTPGKNRVLVLEPSFSANKQQMAILGIEWKGIEIAECSGPLLESRLRSELSRGDVAAIIYSSPNNPSWMCLSDSELQTIAKVAGEAGTVIIEDQAYFCMDFRQEGYDIPYRAPYPPSAARYTGDIIILLSGSKIFSYAGQRIGVMYIGRELYERCYPALASRYGGSGMFGLTITGGILDMITSGCTASTQWGLAAMMDASCDGTVNFVNDTRIYAERASRMKEIFSSGGFNISYPDDAEGPVGDGFFFTLSYPGMDSNALISELMAYGISTVSLDKMGSSRHGVRVCSSRIRPDQFTLLRERVEQFSKDHPISKE